MWNREGLLHEVEFIYSARKIVHSEGYILVHTKMTKIQSTKETTKGENKPENNPTTIYSGNKQVSTIYEGVLEFCMRHRSSTLASSW